MFDWDDEARHFGEHWARLAEPARLAIADAVDLAGASVLDVGCGNGDFCALALARGARVSGIDAAPAMIETARERAPAADLRVGRAEALPFEDGAFDARHRVQRAAVRRRHGDGAARMGPGGGAPSPSARGPRASAARSTSSRPRCAHWAESRSRRRDVRAAPRAVAREARARADRGGGRRGPVRGRRPGGARGRVPARRARLRGVDAVGETAARAATTAAAAPFRRDDGSYRFENVFRYVIGRPAERPTPAAT